MRQIKTKTTTGRRPRPATKKERVKMGKTVNRGWLKKQVLAGNVEAICSYNMTDDYKRDAANNFGKTTTFVPCRIKSGFEIIEGCMNFYESDFRSKCGAAWMNENGTICFMVHSNRSYDLRIKGACKK